MGAPQPTDTELCRRVLAGERELYGELVDRHWSMALHLALRKLRRRADAEDVAQEAFIKAFDKLATLEDRSRFAGWLSRIVYHLAVDRLRKRSSAPGPQLEAMDFRDPTWESPGAVLERREKLQQVRQAVSSLDDRYLLPITLRYYSGLSLAEVAHQLDLPLGTVKVRLHRGVRKLRAKLNSPLKEA